MKKRSLKLKSVASQIHEIEKFVEEICDENNINTTYFGNIVVAVTEAFENAMIHGNGSDPEKNIYLSFETRQKGLMFEIRDEGKGFDFEKIPDATDVETNPDKKGTGIFLIRSLADEVRYTDGGRTMQMLFYISSIHQQMSLERISKLKAYKEANKEKLKNKDKS